MDALIQTAERTGWRVPAVLDDLCLVLAALLVPEARERQAVLQAAAHAAGDASVAVGPPRPDGAASVSVLLTCCDDATTVTSALASALAQTERALELIVVDRGSNDDSIDRVTAALAGAGIPSRLLRSPDANEAAALNAAAAAASGCWLAFLDPDARWAPNRIERLVQQIAGHGARWGFSAVALSGEGGEPEWNEIAGAQRRHPSESVARDPESFAFLAHDATRADGNLFIERALFLELGGFRTDGRRRTWRLALEAGARAEPIFLREPSYVRAGPAEVAEPSVETTKDVLRECVRDSLAAGSDCANPLSPLARANRLLLLRHLFAHGLGALVPTALIHDLARGLRRMAAAPAQPEPTADGAPLRKTAIVVLGVHRSGTSALTRTLNLCGAALPERLIPSHAEQNPTGFWEPTDVVAFNERVLEQLGAAWDRPDFVVPDDPAWTDEFSRDVGLFLATELGERDTIVIKDPRIVLLAQPWHRALQAHGYRPVYVVPVRHPLEVARSLHARDAMSERAGLALWQVYMQRIDAFAAGGAELVFVRSSDLLHDWRGVLGQVADRLDVRLDLRSHAGDVDAFLQPALRRQRVEAHEAQLLRDDVQLIAIQALYDALSARCAAPSTGAAGSRIDAGDDRANRRDAEAATASFVLCIEDNGIREQALLLCESIRRFAGRHRHAPIYAFSPRPGLRIDAQAIRALERLDVRYVDEPLNATCPEYASANRVFAAAWAERHDQSDFVVVLDSDTLFLGEPLFPVDADAAVRPVDVKGSATAGPGDAFEVYWVALAALAGTSIERLPFIEATVSGERIRASYNGGLVVARRERGLLGRWADLFSRSVAGGLRPYRDRDNDVYASTGYVGKAAGEYWGSNQAALALTLWSRNERVVHYPAQYNVPLHLLAADGAIDPCWSSAPPIHVHYHWMFQPEHHALALSILDQLGAPADRLAWLARRLPLGG